MITQKHFYMIRHGETEANAARVMAGSTDSPLTDLGREQAKAVQSIIPHLEIKPAAIVHSHLSRARHTAEIINEVLNIELHEDPDLAELCAGDWEGVSYDDCGALLNTYTDPPNGETFDEFEERIIRGKNRHIDKHDGPVLIVCHGGVFRAFGKIYGLETQGRFQNCHLHEFHPNDDCNIFPWHAHHYNQDESGNVFKSRAELYHDDPALRIAS